MSQESFENLPIIDFQDLTSMLGSEQTAMEMLGMFDNILRGKKDVITLLDAVLYEKSEDIMACAHSLKGAAGYIHS